ncbi:LuxR C-terminal-related transcriptional regulator [Streptomyces sp. NPDC020490]|uniref:LuxR C-terminal-related transcriptional regulator n=1 Tax=Streptomyces sp. NPDC020490 TaxID=3365078 RepID=UPI003795C85F
MNTRNSISRWPLVGRSEEIKEFENSCLKKHNQGILVSGAAGVGKSRLAAEFLGMLSIKGWKTYRATASEAAAKIPLGAVAHLIPRSIDLSNPDRGFTAAIHALVARSGNRKSAILVDDMQLLDASSALFISRLLDADAVRVIGTFCTGSSLSDSVQSIVDNPNLHRLHLGELSQQQTEKVLQAALGAPVSRHTVADLFAASGGNIFYLRELVLGSLASYTLVPGEGIWELVSDKSRGTPRLAELIDSRISQAGPESKTALELLALCEPVPLADFEEAASTEEIMQLERLGIVNIASERRRSLVTLAHPLYGKVIKCRMTNLRRRSLLLEQAGRIERRGARRREDTLRIATWQLAATGTADPEMLYQAAGLARHAHDFKQVVNLLEALPENSKTVRALLLLADSLFLLGDASRAESVLAEADALAESETEKLDVTLLRTWSLFWIGRTDDALSANRAALQATSGPSERQVLRIIEGCIRSISGTPLRACEIFEELDADPSRLPKFSVWTMGTMLKSAALTLVGRTSEARQLSERAYELSLNSTELALTTHPVGHLICLAYALSEEGRIAEARQTCQDAWATLDKIQDHVSWIWLSYISARSEWLAGRPKSARRWFLECIAKSKSSGNHRALRLAMSGLSACASILGDVETARSIENELRTIGMSELRAGEDRLGEAWLLAASGKMMQAQAVLLEAAFRARKSGEVVSEALLLTDAARMGAGDVAERLGEIADHCDGPLARARVKFAEGIASNNPDELFCAAEELSDLDATLLAAEAFSAASSAWGKAGLELRAKEANRRAKAHARECEGARTPLLATTQATAHLTAREREISFLAAAGESSKNIAAHLGVSVRTVENHLQRTYIKLGVTGRKGLFAALTMYSDVELKDKGPRHQSS